MLQFKSKSIKVLFDGLKFYYRENITKTQKKEKENKKKQQKTTKKQQKETKNN